MAVNLPTAIIDDREHDLCNCLDTLKILYKKEHLDMGDIIINGLDGELLYIIERKSASDLAASIKDGRWREQKLRLMGNYPLNKIMYLIEGKIAKGASLSAITNTLVRDGLAVHRVPTITDSALFVESMIASIWKHGKGGSMEHQKIQKYTQVIKPTKKENMDQATCMAQQIAMIPGISIEAGEAIVKKYGTLRNMIKKADSDELATISYITKSGKEACIGHKKAQRIYDFICA
jgi:ERCC4-type nuclease